MGRDQPDLVSGPGLVSARRPSHDLGRLQMVRPRSADGERNCYCSTNVQRATSHGLSKGVPCHHQILTLDRPRYYYVYPSSLQSVWTRPGHKRRQVPTSYPNGGAFFSSFDSTYSPPGSLPYLYFSTVCDPNCHMLAPGLPTIESLPRG